MSILILGAEGAVGEAVIARLIDQGDEVRVVEQDAEAADRWRALGAHVASGSPADEDLVERAAQNARTLVLLQDMGAEPIIRAAARAGVGRVVLCAGGDDQQSVESSALEFVVLVMPRTRFARRARLAPEALAEAVDAADDLAGAPRMYANLADESGWRELGLDPPKG